MSILLSLVTLPLHVVGQGVTEEWARRYGGVIPTQESSVYLAVDNDGNSYIGGNSSVTGTANSIVIAKFGLNGDEVWRNGYSNGRSDNISAITVDELGNVYILGTSIDNSLHINLLILKYSSADGSLLWSATYNPARNTGGLQILLDNKGGIFVTGVGQAFPGAFHFLSKFNSNDGALIWSKTLLPLIRPSDSQTAAGMAIDGDGNVYITGTKSTAETPQLIVTSKYKNSDGSIEWSTPYDTGLNGRALGIAVDEAGGVYITGYKSSSSDDAFLLKYNASDGKQQWLNEALAGESTFQSAIGLKVDNAGGVYLAGVLNDVHQVVKYNSSNGEEDWSATFPGTVKTLAVDGTGGVYVAGKSSDADYEIRKYSAEDGDLLWKQFDLDNGTYNDSLSEVLIGSSGDLFLAGISSGQVQKDIRKMFVAKLTASDGTQNWKERLIKTVASSELPSALATDENGNIYVTGRGGLPRIFSESSNKSIVTIKYSPSGDQLWVKEILAGADTAIVVSGFVVDTNGDVYLAGTRYFPPINSEMFLVKLNSGDGSLLWQKTYGGASNIIINYGIVQDEQGGIYLIGHNNFSLTTDNATHTLKFDAQAGELLWEASFSGGISAASVAAKNGEVYVAINSRHEPLSAENSQDITLLAYNDDSGDLVWSQPYDSGFNDEVSEMVLDDEAGIYILGSHYDKNSSVLALALKANAQSRKMEWTKEYANHMTDLEVDGNNGLYLLGYSEVGIGIWKLKTADGEQAWMSDYYVNETAYAPQSIAVDEMGGVYITSTFDGDIATLKFNASTGNKVWETLKDADIDNISTTSPLVNLVLDQNLDVIVSGYVYSQETERDYLTIKYSQELDPCNIPVEVKLYLPPVAKRVGWQVRTTADFGSYTLTEDTGIRWTWGDGTPPTISYTAFGTPRITGEHTYTKAGIYQIELDFSQSCLKPTNSGYEQWMPIFDPEAGFVTGAGQATALGQRLGFNFSLGYSGKFATEPRGHTHFLIQDLGMFRSRSLEWLVVSGNKAAWKGEGVIDGKGRYSFIASVTDAGNPGPDDAGDRLRVKVWDRDRGNRVVYDSFAGGGEMLDMDNQGPTIDKGNIIIHRPGNVSITAKANSRAQTAENGSQLTAYPNTFSERTRISFTLEQGQHYTLEIYDTKGRLVKQLAQGRAEASTTYEHELNGKGLNEGLYIARLVTVNGSQSIKLLLKR